METAEWRLPVRRSESPTGYPQQSPLPLHQSPTIVAQSQCGVWLRSSVALIVSAPNGVSSLLCAPGDISILHRHFLTVRRRAARPVAMATDAPPTLSEEDPGIDRDWFREHRARTCL